MISASIPERHVLQHVRPVIAGEHVLHDERLVHSGHVSPRYARLTVGIGGHLRERALAELLSVVEHHVVADPLDDRHLVLDEHDGQIAEASPDLEEVVHQPCGLVDGHPGRRLVEEQEPGG